jgi:antirestriction protein ArdC
MNIYTTITERILSQLDAGTIPWRKTWTTGLPKSLGTGREYRGVNILVLGASAHTSRYWVTYREALRLGGHVRKGEQAQPVIYWNWRTQKELEELRRTTGKERLAPCVPFVSAVFNLDQVEGVTRPEDDVPAHPHRRLEVAERMLDLMPNPPPIVHTVTAEPSYSPRLDLVTLPHLSQFESADSFYATLYHEMVHAVGHPKRLNRFSEAEGERIEQYSMEELVAEFGAAFLCAFAGLSNPVNEALQAAYIQGWAQALRKDAHLLVRAASAAQRAADYIRGKVVLQEVQAAA